MKVSAFHDESSPSYLTERIHGLLDIGQVNRAVTDSNLDGVIYHTLDTHQNLHGRVHNKEGSKNNTRNGTRRSGAFDNFLVDGGGRRLGRLSRDALRISY